MLVGKLHCVMHCIKIASILTAVVDREVILACLSIISYAMKKMLAIAVCLQWEPLLSEWFGTHHCVS